MWTTGSTKTEDSDARVGKPSQIRITVVIRLSRWEKTHISVRGTVVYTYEYYTMIRIDTQGIQVENKESQSSATTKAYCVLRSRILTSPKAQANWNALAAASRLG